MSSDAADGETETTATDPVEHVSGTGIAVRGDDIDTDQILPARFLKVLTFEGLGEFAFFDQRFEEVETDHGTEEVETDHPFNDPEHRRASVLVVNSNFGCGSSREHAPQALQRWGIDAVVGESFAEIFAGNCLALGVPTVTMDGEAIEALQSFVEANPDADVAVDVAAETVAYDGRRVEADVDDTQHHALVNGQWDTTAQLAAVPERIAETANSLPYLDAS
ncbi:3-isopropylmalate dehydratase small subunit [Halomarina oriensis]|uniref:3-isopropylmalate dehydratase n=1 Tax=Halomarina oriensis TaxID=671145 RepID=A0A6B0GNZ9_9EURY|nr:3-isopropylmalate dehydratase small subunit [Halomarina oriensis]MWG35691.1 3-isopropylmalate dehydratase small subunit [Halomarina oriensis]